MTRKTIIQITDMHLFDDVDERLLGVNTYDSFKAVVGDIQRNYPDPDLILLTGDLAQDETVGAYERLIAELGDFHCPKYGFPGNHDDEDNMRSAFRTHHLQQNREIIIGDWNLILLNTQKRHAVEGLLHAEQLDFLNKSLGAYPEHHAFIFMHHPPIPVGSGWIDKLMLSNSDEFWTILDAYHHVKAVFCGHVHQEFTGKKNGVSVYSTPSTCFQFKTNSQKFALEKLMPGYRVIEIGDNGIYNTTVHRISGFQFNLDTSAGGY